MNRKLLPLVSVALCLILLSTVSVSATSPNTPTIGFWTGNMAVASWDFETPPVPPFAMVLLMVEEVPVKVSHIAVIIVNPPTTMIMVTYKELAPGEFGWSMDHAWISTEITDMFGNTHTLVVEWETVSPTLAYHTNEYETYPWGTTHWIMNGVGRTASATLTWGDLTLEMTGNVARSCNVGVTVWEP